MKFTDEELGCEVAPALMCGAAVLLILLGLKWWIVLLLMIPVSLVALLIGFFLNQAIRLRNNQRRNARFEEQRNWMYSEAQIRLHQRVRVKKANHMVSVGTRGTVTRITPDNQVVVTWGRRPSVEERQAYDGQMHPGWREEEETSFSKYQYYEYLEELK